MRLTTTTYWHLKRSGETKAVERPMRDQGDASDGRCDTRQLISDTPTGRPERRETYGSAMGLSLRAGSVLRGGNAESPNSGVVSQRGASVVMLHLAVRR